MVKHERNYCYLVFKETNSPIIINGVNDRPSPENILVRGYASSWTKAAKKATSRAKKLGVKGVRVLKNI